MEKDILIKQTTINLNKRISILLIFIILLSSNYFIPDYTQSYLDKLIFLTPILTLLLIGYSLFYDYNKKWQKIVLVIFIIGSLISIWIILFLTHFMSGRN